MLVGGEIDLFCLAIRKEGQREAEKVLLESQSKAEVLLKEVKEKVTRELETELRRLRAEAHVQAPKIIDAAELTARDRLTRLRETILKEALKEIKKELSTVRQHPDYEPFLLKALKDALDNLPGETFIVEAVPGDEGPLRRAIERLGKGRQITLKTTSQVESGVRVYTADGKILYDNTLTARLRRLEERIQREIWEAVRVLQD
ncbi:V-type ATP synthase subunit E [Thermosulfuriphilus sp.]